MKIGKTNNTLLSETGTTIIQLIKNLKYNIQREHLTLIRGHEVDLVRYINITTSRHQKYHQNNATNIQDQSQDPLISRQTQSKTQFQNILEEAILNIEYELHTEHLLIINEQEFDLIDYVNGDYS